MNTLKPITVYGDFASPNPCKIRIILEELDIPFESELVTFPQAKEERYININPNGRLPAIYDPNTDVTLWETAAITYYLIDQYDKQNRLSYDSVPEKYQIHQWIAFQVSGSGPYYGQAVHFNTFHPEKLPSAIERYEKEIERVRSVLDLHLTNKAAANPSATETWLVGDKLTVADLSWVMWEYVVDFLFGLKGINLNEGNKYPAYEAWIGRLFARPACKRAISRREVELRASDVWSLVREDFRELPGVKAELQK